MLYFKKMRVENFVSRQYQDNKKEFAYMQCIESFQKNDLKAVTEYDAEFHRFIIHTTKNSRIEATIRNLIKLSKCIVVKSDDSLSSQDIDALRQFLNALRDSNESLAEELMRKRVAASKKYHFNRYYMGEYN